MGAGLLKNPKNHRERHSSRVRLVDIQRQELQTSPMETNSLMMPAEWMTGVSSPTSEKKGRPLQPDLIIKTKRKPNFPS